jgi:hypothetical protein
MIAFFIFLADAGRQTRAHGAHPHSASDCNMKLMLVFYSLSLSLFPQTFRHGFPHNPTALAFDPVQKLLAIGDKYGSLRM